MNGSPPADDPPQEYASPACSMHAVDPAYMGVSDTAELTPAAITWRTAQRSRLIAARLAVPADLRDAHAQAIAANLDRIVGDPAGKTISLYWPFRGEPDLRGWMADVTARGGTCLLPMVAGKAKPLLFRAWRAGAPLTRGVWNIPFPATGPEMEPDIVIAPVVGYDDAFYRLGYGGGFYDRTLASLARPFTAIGVGYRLQRLKTIHPHHRDVPMQAVVTEAGVMQPAAPR